MSEKFSRFLHGLRIAVIGKNPKVTLIRIVVLVAVCFTVFRFILLPIRVEGISMWPTYRNGSINFINRLAYVKSRPQRGDIVGIQATGSNSPLRTPGVMYLKRVIGLPGESVAFSEGHVLINRTNLDEPYEKESCDWNAPPVTDESDQYYVVGDNRTMPPEDHSHGRVRMDQIVGKALY